MLYIDKQKRNEDMMPIGGSALRLRLPCDNLDHGEQVEGGYRPRFGLDPSVIRLPIVPGSDPRTAYGDLVQRGVKGVVLEAFGKYSHHV